MRFSELKKDKTPQANSFSPDSSLQKSTRKQNQYEGDIVNSDKDFLSQKSDVKGEKSYTDEKKSLNESNENFYAKDNMEDKKDFSQKIPKKIEMRFDEIEYEKTLSFYSLLLRRFDGIVKKVLDEFYLSILDDLMYLSHVILQELENPYLPLLLRYFTPGNYIISHSVNIAILSGLISKTLNFKEEDILNIITASLCIDLGMLSYRNLYSQARILSDAEREIIKMHVEDGVDIVEKIFSLEGELKRFVIECVENSHERYDGSGYYSKKADELDDIWQIISISDFYEALSHPRSWRDAFDEPEVIELITSKYRGLFSPRVVKGLVSSLGVYPPGSICKLSTGEIAEVVFVNKEKIFRPFVRVFMDDSFKEITPFYLDLAQYPLTSIDGYIKSKELLTVAEDVKKRFDLKRLWLS